MRLNPLFFLLLLLFVGAGDDWALAQSGAVRVIDGDSVVVGGAEIRLLCVDAVELHQSCLDGAGRDYACGVEAQKAMLEVVADARADCRGNERDRYGRLLAYCSVGSVDLSRAMIERGWAVSMCEKFSAVEEEAKASRRGIWQGSFTLPRQWRRQNPWKKN